MAANGKDMLTGIELYLEEIGYEVAGRKIDLIIEDDEANPAVSLTKTRKLVERDGVHIMTGGMMASTGYALAPYIDSKEIPMTYPLMAPDHDAEKKSEMDCSDRMERQPAKSSLWRVRLSDTQVQKNRNYWAGLCLWLGVRGRLPETFEEAGGKIVQKIWVPLTVTDFSPYLAQISRDVDAVWAVFTGRSALQFVKQYQEFGLKEKIPLIGVA